MMIDEGKRRIRKRRMMELRSQREGIVMDVGRKTESEGVGKGKVCTSLPE